MGYMPRPQTVGETTPCPECASKGITVIIKAVESEYLGNKRLSLKNPDGSGHIKTNGTDEKGKPIFVHNPPTSAEQSTILPDLKEKIDACEKTLGDDTDQFAIFYMALRNKFNDYVNETDVNKKGMIVGHMITNYIQCGGNVPYPVEFKKASSKPAETWGNTAKSIHSEGSQTRISNSVLPNAVKGIEETNGNDLPSLPSPFSHKQADVRFVPKCVKHGVLCNEKTFECSLCTEETEPRNESNKWVAGENNVGSPMVDKRLLL